MKIEIKLNHKAIRRLEQAALAAAIEALEVLCTDIANSYTMPFDTGNMQNGGTYTAGFTVEGNSVINMSEGDEIHVCLTNDAPQARRLYYHPEYNFQRGKNKNAGAYWLEPYIRGNKKEFVKAEFIETFRKRSGI